MYIVTEYGQYKGGRGDYEYYRATGPFGTKAECKSYLEKKGASEEGSYWYHDPVYSDTRYQYRIETLNKPE